MFVLSGNPGKGRSPIHPGKGRSNLDPSMISCSYCKTQNAEFLIAMFRLLQGKFLKAGRVVVMLQGRYAGKKVGRYWDTNEPLAAFKSVDRSLWHHPSGNPPWM